MSIFRHEREIPAPPGSVFEAFRCPGRLARWWGPEGFSSTFDTFEFREGGAWLFTMHGPDGTDYPNQSEFLEIVPDALVRIRHVNLPRFELSITLEARGAGTRVSWVGVFENQEFAERMRPFLESANEQNLDRWAREVAAGALKPGMEITVETTVAAPVEEVWRAYTTPEDILAWNAASDHWHTTAATVDLRPGGAFSSRMEARDGSLGFDFAGTYTEVVPLARIAYVFGGRSARVTFAPDPGGVRVRVTFEAEAASSEEQQRQGWQSILDNFRKHVERGRR